MTRPAIITQPDLRRLLRSGADAGFPVVNVQIRPDGTINVRYEAHHANDDRTTPGSWDDVLPAAPGTTRPAERKR